MYRFRSVDCLLDKFHELENQEIYFASPSELNDPMEGLSDIYWLGDKIVWINFFKHYLFCLNRIALLAYVQCEKDINYSDIPIRGKLERETEFLMSSNLMDRINARFFKLKFTRKLINYLSSTSIPIRRSQLISILNICQLYALHVITSEYKTRKFIKTSLFENITSAPLFSLFTLISDFERIEDSPDTELVFSMLSHYFEDISTQYKSQWNDNINNHEFNNKIFLLTEFTTAYVNKLEELIFPNWYSASFVSTCDNLSLWGHYGDGHKGVCLKFKTLNQGNNFYIDINSIQPLVDLRPMQFYKIHYCNDLVSIDFFRSIANSKMNKMQLLHFWYQNQQGEMSKCAEHFINREAEYQWSTQCQVAFLQSITTKLKDWEYENEYRLVLNASIVDYEQVESRKLNYNFSDLEAVIFGVRTSEKDKSRIIKIIRDKCQKEKRYDFEFYQAYYSISSKQIALHRMHIDLHP